MVLKTFLVFYGFLSIYFGWSYYGVVFISFGVAIYTAYRFKELFKTAEVFIKTITYLGILDLLVASAIAIYKTAQWLSG